MFVAILQARMACSRLPGKAMAPLAGEPMIWRQIERLRGEIDRARDEALVDALTGLANRRRMSELLEEHAQRARRVQPLDQVPGGEVKKHAAGHLAPLRPQVAVAQQRHDVFQAQLAHRAGFEHIGAARRRQLPPRGGARRCRAPCCAASWACRTRRSRC